MSGRSVKPEILVSRKAGRPVAFVEPLESRQLLSAAGPLAHGRGLAGISLSGTYTGTLHIPGRPPTERRIARSQ